MILFLYEKCALHIIAYNLNQKPYRILCHLNFRILWTRRSLFWTRRILNACVPCKYRILACDEFAIPRNGKMSRRRAGAVRAPYGRRRILVIFWGIANSSQSGSKEITRSYILAAAYRTSETSEASRSHRKVIWRWQLGARTGILWRPLTAQCWVMYL